MYLKILDLCISNFSTLEFQTSNFDFGISNFSNFEFRVSNFEFRTFHALNFEFRTFRWYQVFNVVRSVQIRLWPISYGLESFDHMFST